MPYLPDGGGYKAPGPSKEAAQGFGHAAETIRSMVLDVLDTATTPLSADEIAAHLDIDFMSVRPRVSELHLDGLVRDSGIRRLSRSGKSATGWIRNRKDQSHE